MTKNVIPIFILALIFNGCQKEEAKPSIEKKILSNWQVVTESYDPSVVEWGFFYVASVKLYEDKTFKLNIGSQPDDPNLPKHGTWKLVNKEKSLVFYSYINDGGTIHRDTTDFKISFDPNDKLVLENDWIKILHERSNN
jgi:hypothetical protein